MGSPPSSRSRRSQPVASNTLKERWASALAWTTSHRYAALSIVTVVCVLICLAICCSLSTPVASLSDDDDELAALDEIEGLEVDLGKEVASHPIRVTPPRPEQHARFDDLVPMFASNAAPEPGIVSAMFEGTSRSVDTGPVWLAGTIETDDFSPHDTFIPAVPASIQPTAGPLLTPP